MGSGHVIQNLCNYYTMTGPIRLAVPRRVKVDAGADGCPVVVDGRTVDAVRESWLVEDRWWTDRPLRRRYWEVVEAALTIPTAGPRLTST